MSHSDTCTILKLEFRKPIDGVEISPTAQIQHCLSLRHLYTLLVRTVSLYAPWRGCVLIVHRGTYLCTAPTYVRCNVSRPKLARPSNGEKHDVIDISNGRVLDSTTAVLVTVHSTRGIRKSTGGGFSPILHSDDQIYLVCTTEKARKTVSSRQKWPVRTSFP